MINKSNNLHKYRPNPKTQSFVGENKTLSSPVVKYVFRREEKHETQASRIIERFGSPYKLSKLLAQVGHPKNPTSIYRWMYSKEKGGCGGVVPTAVWPYLLKAARLEGIMLGDQELTPEKRSPKGRLSLRLKTLLRGKKLHTSVKVTINLSSNERLSHDYSATCR